MAPLGLREKADSVNVRKMDPGSCFFPSLCLIHDSPCLSLLFQTCLTAHTPSRSIWNSPNQSRTGVIEEQSKETPELAVPEVSFISIIFSWRSLPPDPCTGPGSSWAAQTTDPIQTSHQKSPALYRGQTWFLFGSERKRSGKTLPLKEAR